MISRPSLRRASTRCEPMKPAPPVTRTCGMSGPGERSRESKANHLATPRPDRARGIARVKDAPRMAHDEGVIEDAVIRDDDGEVGPFELLALERDRSVAQPAVDRDLWCVRVAVADVGAPVGKQLEHIESRRFAHVPTSFLY